MNVLGITYMFWHNVEKRASVHVLSPAQAEVLMGPDVVRASRAAGLVILKE